MMSSIQVQPLIRFQLETKIRNLSSFLILYPVQPLKPYKYSG